MSKFLAILLLVIVCVPALGASQEVIVDNGSASYSGTGWTATSTGSGYYGTDYRYVAIQTSGTKTATYTPNLPVTAGDWAVYVRHPSGSTTPSLSVRVTVHHAGGDTVFYPDQSYNTNGGGLPVPWYYLGTFKMNSGTGNYVQIRNIGPDTSKRVNADAVRFYSASGGVDTTPPTISSVSACPWYDGVAVSWTTNEASTSQVDYGPTASYGSTTTEDTNLVTSHTVYVLGLPTGTERHFRVRSKDGLLNTSVSGDYTWTTAADPVPEFRASWADSWGNGFLNAAQVTSYVDTCYGANYNVIVPEVRKAGDAYYVSAYEPRASNITDPVPYDPLQDMIDKAHAKGKWPNGKWRMEVHPWIVTYRCWNTTFPTLPSDHVWALHGAGMTPWYDDWAMKTNTGGYTEGNNRNLDPGVPGVQDYIAKVVVDIVSNYDVDGFNYDYIRYPGVTWGYNEITRQRFYSENGVYPPQDKPTLPEDPGWLLWETWCQFRRQQVTDLVKKCYLEIIWRKPHVNMHVDTVGWLGGDPSIDFTGTRQYYDVFQNSKLWMEQHIIDTNLCMNYNREHDAAQKNNYRLWSNWLASMEATTGRIGASGPGVYMNSIPAAIAQKTYSRAGGCGGIGSYSYQVTNKDGLPASDFWNALTGSLFNSGVPTPDMPWKTAPTTGVIFGTVTTDTQPDVPTHQIYKNWVYKATVQVTGPVTRSTETDATGTFGFMDLPPGTYTVTCSKAGFNTRIYDAQTILAGDVLREDFDISPSGQISVSSPASAVPGKACFSLPYEPIDPAPESVFTIPIHFKLWKWDRVYHGLQPYDMNSPELFGNMSLDEGYWLRITSPYTISYQAYPGNPGSRTQSLPKAGWSIIGCPWPTEHAWADMRITNGSTTVSLAQAKANGWVNSIGNYWDAVGRGFLKVGLPEDNPWTENLQPWHGHWFKTYVDNLQLTQRLDGSVLE